MSLRFQFYKTETSRDCGDGDTRVFLSLLIQLNCTVRNGQAGFCNKCFTTTKRFNKKKSKLTKKLKRFLGSLRNGQLFTIDIDIDI